MPGKGAQVSRRMFCARAAGCAGAIVPATATATSATRTVSGRVAWCDRRRGLLKIRVDGKPAPQVLVEYRSLHGTDPEHLQDLLRPGTQLTLALSPQTGVAMHWGVQEIIGPDGRLLPVRAQVQSLTWPDHDKVADVLDVVSRHFDVPVADILSQRRSQPIVEARQVGLYLAHTLTEHSLPEIGRRFGNRDHTTVLHAIRKIDAVMARDANAGEKINRLAAEIDHIADKHFLSA